MMKGRQKAVALVGLILLAVTLVLFFLPGGKKEALDWVCLMFLLLAELALAGGGILADRAAEARGGIFLRSGVLTALLLCCVLSIAVSLVSILWVRPPAVGLAGVQIVLFAVGAVPIIALTAFGRRVGTEEARTGQSLSAWKELEGRSAALAARPSSRPYAPSLQRVADAIRYADSASVSALDGEITGKLTELEQYLSGPAEEDGVDRRAEELLCLLERRGREVKERKAGKT